MAPNLIDTQRGKECSPGVTPVRWEVYMFQCLVMRTMFTPWRAIQYRAEARFSEHPNARPIIASSLCHRIFWPQKLGRSLRALLVMYNDAIAAARLPAQLNAPASTRRLLQASPHLHRCYLNGLIAT